MLKKIIKRKIKKILRSVEIPYNMGVAFYCLDVKRRNIEIFTPVERLTGEVGKAIVYLYNAFDRKMPKWNVWINSELTHDIELWGIPKNSLIEVIL